MFVYTEVRIQNTRELEIENIILRGKDQSLSMNHEPYVQPKYFR